MRRPQRDHPAAPVADFLTAVLTPSFRAISPIARGWTALPLKASLPPSSPRRSALRPASMWPQCRNGTWIPGNRKRAADRPILKRLAIQVDFARGLRKADVPIFPLLASGLPKRPFVKAYRTTEGHISDPTILLLRENPTAFVLSESVSHFCTEALMPELPHSRMRRVRQRVSRVGHDEPAVGDERPSPRRRPFWAPADGRRLHSST